jgi:RNA polymerase sigma factor (sigma-70 family)
MRAPTNKKKTRTGNQQTKTIIVINPQELHSKIRKGDSKAEAELASFLRNTFRAEYSQTLGPLAEDYLQDLCIHVIDGIRNNKVDHPEKLIPYCKSVASNIRFDGLRSAASAARRLVPIEEGKNRQSSGNIENELILAEQFSTVLKLMEYLDPVSREIVRRYYFERQKAERIQRAMRLTEVEFRGKKDRAVRKLRDDHQAMVQQWRAVWLRFF